MSKGLKIFVIVALAGSLILPFVLTFGWVMPMLKKQQGESATAQAAYRTAINSSPYAQIGVQSAVKPGYLRQYNQPKKVVVIGNSITQHGFLEADGIDWTVSDMREMAASRPDSGWVTLIKKYFNEALGLTDCEIWKGNGSTWEVTASGTRTIDKILNQAAYRVETTGTDLATKTTFDQVLTADVDLILIQLSENMPAPTTAALRQSDYQDWRKLYQSLSALCPQAQIYQMTGFWPQINKVQTILSVATNPVFNPMLITSNVNTNYAAINLKAQPGDKIYDAAGQEIATVSSAVAGHPNDYGFMVMAEQFLDALFNDRSYANNADFRHAYYIDYQNPAATTVFKPTVVKELFNAKSVADWDEFNTVHSWLAYVCLGGLWSIAIQLPGEHTHQILKVTVSESRNASYIPCKQEIILTNNSKYESVYRSVKLSGDSENFGTWNAKLK